MLKEACGVFGIWGNDGAAWLTYLGLYALQHRGQESAGICVLKDGVLHIKKGLGLVSDIFSEADIGELIGRAAIGHVRYSTTGSPLDTNAQPFLVKCSKGLVAIAHNGNLVNALELRRRLEAAGAIFQTSMDSEVIIHLLARSRYDDMCGALMDSLRHVRGAYSLAILTPEALVGVRDPMGFRPLVLGKLGDAWVLSSETCAFDLINAEYVREIEPGEIVRINDGGVDSVFMERNALRAHCIFEYIYFARPDSVVFGRNVHQVRQELGRRLAREHPADADIVIAVPDSGNSAAMGYAAESGIPFEMGLVRNHYIGRTFIEPSSAHRDLMVRIKINPIREVLEGKSIVVVDDSIVRATTSRKRVDALKRAGAKEVHMRISSPPITHSCFYGIDTPDRSKLIAASKTVDEIKRTIGVDSLGYLSIEGMLSAVPPPPDKYCVACFTGRYPVEVPPYVSKEYLEVLDYGRTR